VRPLGADVEVCATFGGETGAVLRALIAAEGVDVAGIVSAADNGAYVHDRRTVATTSRVAAHCATRSRSALRREL
jgi:1-phosphofructokinase